VRVEKKHQAGNSGERNEIRATTGHHTVQIRGGVPLSLRHFSSGIGEYRGRYNIRRERASYAA